MTRFTVATKERWRDTDGEWQEKTTWHNVQVWGKYSEVIMKAIRKGDNVLIQGKINNYKNEETGKSYTNIVASSVDRLNQHPKEDGEDRPARQPKPRVKDGDRHVDYAPPAGGDDDDPLDHAVHGKGKAAEDDDDAPL